MDSQPINRFMSPIEKDQLYEVVQGGIQDIMWDEFLYNFYSTSQTASSNSTLGNTGISAVSGPIYNDQVIRHDRPTRFRAAVVVETATTARFYVTTIDDTYVFGDKQSAVGFKLQNNVIYGVSHANGKETATQIGTYEQNVGQILELKYFPKERVDFYINKQFKASITTNLPVSTNNGSAVIDFCTVTSETVATNNGGTITVGYFEFMQDRK